MTAASCTDSEFVELWRTHQSAQKLANILGITLSNVYRRRRTLEAKFNEPLKAVDVRTKYYRHLSPESYPHRKELEVTDGHVLIFSDAHFWPAFGRQRSRRC